MLNGERVVLRAMERADLHALHSQLNDLEVESRASGGRPVPVTLAELEARFDARAAAGEPGVIRFVISVGGMVVGSIQLHTFDDYALTCHVGIALDRTHWGRGYGSESLALILDYAFTHLNVRKVCLEVLADDERAVGSYRKVGFVEEGRFRLQAFHQGQYRDVLRMAVFSP